MAVDSAAPRSRRALLAAALGAGAATVASAIGRPLPARAAGDPVLLEETNYVYDNTTSLIAQGFVGVVLDVWTDGTAIRATAGSREGISGTAVYGSSLLDDYAPPIPLWTGVAGYAQGDPASKGIYGRALEGTGVYGLATTGVAVRAISQNPMVGTSLRANGRVSFDRSVGIATIISGTNSVTVTPGIDLTGSSAVVATLQGFPGGTTTVQRCIVNTTANTFTIYLTANSTNTIKVAWHVFG